MPAATSIAQVRVKGKFAPGVSGNPGGSSRARENLNRDTVIALHEAFREGGAEAIRKVMKTQPAVFLKLLVLLVPRELKVEHSGGVKAMSDEQLEAALEALTASLERRANGDGAKVIEAESTEIPPPVEVKPRRTRRKSSADMVPAMGKTKDVSNS